MELSKEEISLKPYAELKVLLLISPPEIAAKIQAELVRRDEVAQRWKERRLKQVLK